MSFCDTMWLLVMAVKTFTGQFCKWPLLLFTPFSFGSWWWPKQCVTVFNLLRKPICYKLFLYAFVRVHVVTWYVKVGSASCIRNNFRFLTVNVFANNRLIQWPFVLVFFPSSVADYVMKQQVLLIVLLKPQFWILWILYPLTVHQSLLLIDSRLQCSAIRYAFATSQDSRNLSTLWTHLFSRP